MSIVKDLHNNIKVTSAFAPAAAVTGNTAQVSSVLTRGQFAAVELVGILGTNADADMTLTLLVEDSPDNSSFTAVDDAFLLGTEAGVALDFADDGVSFKIGYIGQQKYVRATITPANNTGNQFLAGMWIESCPRKAPQSTQAA
jgi:hypothetical protein